MAGHWHIDDVACSSNPTTSPNITLEAIPNVIAPGQSSQLRWQISGSEPITLRLSPEVDTALSSPLTVFPTETTTYTLTASNSVGSDSASVTVKVTDEPTISGFRAMPVEGTVPLTVTFTWTLNVATSCTFDPGDGSAPETIDGCLTDPPTTYTATHTYQRAGTYEARLTLENGNPSLTTLTGLALTDIAGALTIGSNDLLNDISALAGLNSIGVQLLSNLT